MIRPSRLLRRAALLACGLAVIVLASDLLAAQGRRNPRRMATEMVDGHEVVAGEVLVRFRDQRRAALDQAIAELETDADEVETVGRRGLRRLHSRRHGTRALMSRLRANPEVELVEPNFVIRLGATPNDPSFNSLWGLFNFGQNIGGTGIAGADISAPAAWDITTGSRAHVVGVVDTGIDYNHPDLAANIWSAPAAFSVTIGGSVITCAAGTHGFNAITNTCNPMDDHSHGTHVAGTIGAVGNNGRGIAGVNWIASMMGLKFLSASGSGSTANAIKLIDFAIQAKAAFAGSGAANVRILSNSWGGGGYSQSLKDAIDRADAADMLFVAAAGNNNSNNDSLPHYPSNYASANVVSVAATTNRDLRASFSNWGATTVHLGAPGVSILSTTPNDSYAYYSGTSMATPHVAGAAALVLANCAVATSQLKTLLLNTVDPVVAMSGITTTGGRLNADSAVRACRPPSLTVNGSSNPFSIAAGSALTVVVSDGPGHPGDWVTIVPVGSPDSYWSGTYQFLDGQTSMPATGRSSATLTFTAPATAGQYEFRFLARGTYNRLVTSAAITVTVTSPVPVLTSITPARVPAGSLAFSLTASGSGFVQASQILVDGAARPTTFVSASTLTAVIPATDIAAQGVHTVTVISPAPGGGTSGGLVLTATPPPSLTINGSGSGTVAVATGATLTVGVVDGPGNPGDWVTLVPAGSDPSFWSGTYKFMNGQPTAPATGMSSATLTFMAPATAGNYEIRFLASSGWTRLATRGPIVVTAPNPVPAIGTIAPNGVAQGGADFTLSLIGAGFVPSSTVNVNGSARVTAYVSPTTLTAAILAADIAAVGTRAITVVNPTPGGGTSPPLNLSVVAPPPAPTLASISPAAIGLGGPAFTITATGTQFTFASRVTVNGAVRATDYLSSTSLVAHLTQADRQAFGTLNIAVTTPAPGGGTSATVPLSVMAPALTVNGGSAPVTVAPGAAITVGVAAGPANPGDWVTLVLAAADPSTWSGVYQFMNGMPARPATGASNATLAFTAPSAEGVYEFRFFADSGWTRLATSATVTVARPNPVPYLINVAPSAVPVGSGAFVLTVSGASFVPASVVRINGAARPTTFVSSSSLTTTILATDVANVGTVSVTVATPAPGGGTSGTSTFAVMAPPAAPVLNAITPSTIGSGGTPLQIQVSGANFVPTSQVLLDGSPRATTYVSGTVMTATVLPGDRIAGTRTISVTTPAPGGGVSGGLPLSVSTPALLVNGSASTVTATQGAALVVSALYGPANPADWVTLVPAGSPSTMWSGVYQFMNGMSSPPPSGSASATLTFAAPTAGGTYEFRFYASGGWTQLATSAPVVVVAPNPVPAVSAVSPAAVSAGASAFTLNVNGSNFTATSVVYVNGAARSTTFVSASQLSVPILAGDVAAPGTLSIGVTTPSPGGGSSNAITLAVIAPPAAPSLTNISPAIIGAGATPLTITVTGSNFVPTSIVTVDSQPRATTYVSATTLQAVVLPGDRVAGSHPVGVTTPAPGGGVSGTATLLVTVPTLLVNGGAAPITVGPGAALTVLVAAGPANRGDWVTLVPTGSASTFWSGVYQFMNGQATPPSAGASSATLAFTAPAGAGTYEFRLLADSGWTRLATSPTIVVATPNPVPVISAAAPAAVPAGSGGFTLTVSGSNFVPASVVSVNGTARATAFVSSSQLTASVLAGDVAAIGTMTITVATPAPGGGGSNTASVAVTTPPSAPSLTSITPSSVAPGSTALTITVTGTNFVPTSTVSVDGQPRATTFVSATTLRALVLAGDRVIGSHAISVTTPAPGGGVSGNVALLVTTPALLVNGSATPITVASGSILTVAVSAGPANPGDWVSLVPQGAPDTFWSGTYQFMDGRPAAPPVGASSATLTFVAPAAGTYEFRFFANSGWARLATSAAVVIQ